MIALAIGKTIARCTWRGIGYLSAYLAFGILTSLIAAIFGTTFILVAAVGWQGIIFYTLPLLPLLCLGTGFVLSIPVTFLALPLIALALRDRSELGLLLLSITGAAVGGLVTYYWTGHTSFRLASHNPALFVIAGTLSGLLAGMTYATLVRDTRN